MAFWSSFLLGLLLGVALVGALDYFMKLRSKQRTLKAAYVASLSKLNLEALKRLCGENVPGWISFPEFERVKWMNAELKELWPYVNKAASAVIREEVEPMLEQYRPIGITSLKFRKLTLGDVAPQIGGVKLSKGDSPSQVVMDIDFKWGGDPSIILDIATIAFSLPVQLKDLQVFSTVRLIFQLADQIPCIGALVVSVLATPRPVIEYNLKAVGGSINSIPGLAGMIDELIQGGVEDALVWPKRVITPIIAGYDISALEMRLQGMLTVTVVSAKGLRNTDMIGKSDPYVKLWTRSLYKVQTNVVDNSLNPVWNKTFYLDVDEPSTSHLILKVYDQDTLADEELGIASLEVCDLPPEEEVEKTLPLGESLASQHYDHGSSKGLGSISLKLKYHKYTPEEQSAAMTKDKELKQAKKEGRIKPGETAGAAAAAMKQGLVSMKRGIIGEGLSASLTGPTSTSARLSSSFNPVAAKSPRGNGHSLPWGGGSTSSTAPKSTAGPLHSIGAGFSNLTRRNRNEPNSPKPKH